MLKKRVCWVLLSAAGLGACSEGELAANPQAGAGGGEAAGNSVPAAGGGAGGKVAAVAGAGAGAAGVSGRSNAGGAGASAVGVGGAGSAAHAGAGGGRAGAGGAAAGSGGTAAGSGGSTGGSDGQTFLGNSRCEAAGVWLCEDFESGTLDTQRWKAMSKLPKIDDVHAARGSKALHVSTGATEGSGITTSKIFPTANENYWGRLFVYFDALPTTPAWAHWSIVGANPTNDSAIKGEIRVGGQLDTKINRFGVGTDRGPTGDWTNLDNDPNKMPVAVPLKTWLCIEWQHDGGNDSTRFFANGVEHPSLGTTRDVSHLTNPSVKYDLPTLGSVWFGFWNYNQGKATTPDHYDVWIDEIALDGERIGCEK